MFEAMNRAIAAQFATMIDRLLPLQKNTNTLKSGSAFRQSRDSTVEIQA